MGLNLNFSGVQDGFPRVPDGDYDLVITDVEVKPAASGESDNIIIKAVVDGGEHDGHKIMQYINVQESTMWRVKQFFVALTGDEELEEFDLDDPSVLVGERIGASITDDGQYNAVTAWYSI